MRSAPARYALAVVSLAAALGVSLLAKRHDDAVALCLAAVVLAMWLVVSWARDELTERRQSEHELAGQYAVARILSQSTSIADATPRLLAAIARTTGWEWGALLIADRDNTVLKYRDTWHTADIHGADALAAAVRATVIRRGEGLVGRVWDEGALAIGGADTLPTAIASAAALAGLKSTVAVPLRVGSETLGVLQLMTKAAHPPVFNARQTETLTVLGEQIGQFAHRQQLERDRESLASLVQNSADFVGIASLQGDWMFINPAGQRLVGLDGDADVRATPMRDLVREDVIPAVKEHGVWSGQVRLHHTHTGAEIPMMLHLFAITGPSAAGRDRAVAVAVIGRDLTDLERREQQRKRTTRALRRARERALGARFAAMLDERARVAREIHDSLLQGVTGIALQLRAVLPHVTPSDTLQRIMELAERTSHDARRAIWDLRASSIGDDLTSALDDAVRRHVAGTSIAYHMTVSGRPRRIPQSIVPAAVRVFEEALTNVIKHASAPSVWLTVAYERRLVRITLADSGRGFDPAASPEGHWGVIGMHERAAAIGARLDVRSTVGRGTEVVLEIPNRRGG